MTAPTPGSEAFANRTVRAEDILDRISPTLALHTVDQDTVDSVDPLNYEVIRHRLWSLTDDMADAMKRMSGSIVVTDANDFDFALTDEVGRTSQIALYNTELAAAMDMAIFWTLANRSDNPGIDPGDMFFCNDPWIGGGLHQNDVSLYMPIFYEGKLFSWSSAVAHQLDLGGVGPGSWTPRSENVYWESLPTPPIKMVRDFEVQNDVQDAYLRRSRMPHLVGLDLRAKFSANMLANRRIGELCDRYGPDLVKAVMRRTMDDAETRLRAKLRDLPDGTWTATSHHQSSGMGDRGIYRIRLTMTKIEDRLVFDFTESDPQSGMINCTFAGLRGGVVSAILPLLAGDIPWATSGLTRCFELLSTPGTLNDALHPAGVCKGSIAAAWGTTNCAVETISKMLDTSTSHRARATSLCAGTAGASVFAGTDQRGAPFVTMAMDPMAEGLGARTYADGVDTGGMICIPKGRIPDAEISEFGAPLLYLWRREEPDSGGSGRFRGGLSGSICVVPHRTANPMAFVYSSDGGAVPQNVGLGGGYPGNTALSTIFRGGDVAAQFARGLLPQRLEELDGRAERLNTEVETVIGTQDVYYLYWQAGGGYLDPLTRDPARVREDVVSGAVRESTARDIYGVVVSGEEADLAATEALRTRIRSDRRAAAEPVSDQVAAWAGKTARLSDIRLSENVSEGDSAGIAVRACTCGQVLAGPGETMWDGVVKIVGAPSAAGPQIVPDPEAFVDAEIEFRQLCCPSCLTALTTQVVPVGTPLPTDDLLRR
ncbi:hydantoinase B/oxoprolinase family protein [Amycolatopsis sp. NPDC047767]|uniref:hydantoinase B/oxoprolinase family protein n=1 Tax=Amycolatopsis sp. NPDC047767 TaxID=3156765 RepID=UPI003454BC50